MPLLSRNGLLPCMDLTVRCVFRLWHFMCLDTYVLVKEGIFGCNKVSGQGWAWLEACEIRQMF